MWGLPLKWLRGLWPSREHEVVRQYGAAREVSPLMLADLRVVCMADAPTFDPDPQIAAFQEGKRAVWLHIVQMLNVDPFELEAGLQETYDLEEARVHNVDRYFRNDARDERG